MIREGNRVAIGVSGGKGSLALLDALLLLQRKSPIRYSLHAFTVEQGKLVRPIEPLGDYMKARGIEWTYYRDEPSFNLLAEQPDHGCDLCSCYRRRAVYDIASELGANVVALGHTQDDFCEALLRNTLYTGRLSALPAVTHSRSGDFRLIRPLVYVSEDVTWATRSRSRFPSPRVCALTRRGQCAKRFAAFSPRRNGRTLTSSRTYCPRCSTSILRGCLTAASWIKIPKSPRRPPPPIHSQS